MRRVKYGAVIGHKMRFFVCAQYELPGYGFLFSQSQCRISPSSSKVGWNTCKTLLETWLCEDDDEDEDEDDSD